MDDLGFPREVLYKVLSVVETGSRPPGGSGSDSFGIPSLGGENLRLDGSLDVNAVRRVPGEFFSSMRTGHLKPRDVLINKDGAQTGKVARYGGEFPEAAINEHLFLLRGTNAIDQDYLYRVLRSDATQRTIRSVITGSAQPGLNRSFLRVTRIALPILEEQRRIAEILDTIDETIQATERIIAKLRLVQSGLIDRSFSPSLGTLTELGVVCSGPGEYGCVAAAQPRRAGWPRYVRITDLTDSGTLQVGSEMGVSPSVAQKAILRPGDIVFARSGATVGKTYLYDPADGLCAFAGYLIRFRPDPTKALPEFVQWWTHSSSYWRWVKRTMREGAQPNINAREYAKAVFPLPSIEEQCLIVASIVEVDVEIKAERRCREKLRQLRSGLAADLLSGRVRTVAA